jgi:hypothetical protein
MFLVKAYIRKSNILFAMKDYSGAIETSQQASEVDEEHKHTTEIAQQEMKCQQALYAQRSDESQVCPEIFFWSSLLTKLRRKRWNVL